MNLIIKISDTHSLEIDRVNDLSDVTCFIESNLGLDSSQFYLLQNGKKLSKNIHITPEQPIHFLLRVNGGKGGFGSMLRAIGAQIEKTTNREACRDLSGRRLRDINEEKRLKTWLDGQKERDQEAEDKLKKKIEKLQAKPKHEFKDEAYELARSELTQNVASSVEIGFEKAHANIGTKRKSDEDKSKSKSKKKKKRGALWLGDDLSSSSDTDESDTEAHTSKTVSASSTSTVTSSSSKSSASDLSS